ncbi:MAG: hypothetical protein PHN49_03945 [Candidatus Omnitrophica bacterium]|nr:hypothetical protein [Candidatus Omnitrophota bacterium]MDD5670772.1 hypothetical protein [Candidatus Omnitrophota bacterium]
MSKRLMIIITGMVAGMFLLNTVPAHAILGSRIARRAIAARTAKKALTEKPDTQVQAEAKAKGTDDTERWELNDSEDVKIQDEERE